MTRFQTLIEIIFTSIVLVIASLAFAAYSLFFYAVMIALDGCALCTWLRTYRSPNRLEQKAHGHSLSRT